MKRGRRTVLRFRKNDATHNVLAATQRWIVKNNGDAVVISGIEILEWPGDPAFKYHVAVGVVGRKPEKPKSDQL